MAQLSVTDTGTGISESDLPQLFQRFRRIEGARRRSHEGSGIGLALVRELVEMHGGSIAVESKPGGKHIHRVAAVRGRHLLAPDTSLADKANPVACRAPLWPTCRRRWAGSAANRLTANQPLLAMAADSFRGRDENKPVILVVDDNADMREYLLACWAGASR